MIEGADQKLVAGLLAWADSASTDERDARAKRVRVMLLDGADDGEAARIEALIDEVRTEPKEHRAHVTQTSEPKRDRKLYSPARRGFMRATRELALSPPESPFFDEPATRPATSAALVDKLARLVKR